MTIREIGLRPLLAAISCAVVLSTGAAHADPELADFDPGAVLLADSPGYALAIVEQGELVYATSGGFADLASQQSATQETGFPVFSVAKIWTTTLLARMAEGGEIDPNVPISTYLSTGVEAYDALTAFQLATHTAGVRHYTDQAEARNAGRCETVGDALRIFTDDPLLFAPGEDERYSSWGFVLLSAALEAANDRPFDTLLESRVLTPLGGEIVDEADARAAVAYERSSEGEWIPADIDLSCKFGAGGYQASANTVALVHNRAALGDFLGPDMRSLVYAPRADGAIRAGGFSDGGAAVVVTWPEGALTVAVTVNARPTDADLFAIAYEAADAWRMRD